MDGRSTLVLFYHSNIISSYNGGSAHSVQASVTLDDVAAVLLGFCVSYSAMEKEISILLKPSTLT